MSLIPITTLTPARDPPIDKAIRGVVTLFWPYSSSTRQCAFLLADPDFRLRSKQGQVRVRFTGASAQAVAESHVGIGEEVVLGLEGARWEEDPEAARTPGRSVDGELFYGRKLGLMVKREGGDVRVDVDAPPSPPPRAVEQDLAATFVTPLPKAVDKLRAREVGQGYAYTSPASAKRLRLSEESFLGSAFNPFAVEDMGVDMDEEGENIRTPFGRGINWRYAAKTPSPTKETAPSLDQHDAGAESPTRKPTRRGGDTTTSLADEGISGKMPPPPRPRLQLSSVSPPLESPTAVDGQEAPSTPKLLPVKSPTLPLPSPFPTDRVSQSQFDQLVANRSASNATNASTARLVQSQDDEAISEAPHRSDQEDIPPPLSKSTITQPETPVKAPLTAGFGFGFDGAAPAASPPALQKTSPQDEEKQRVMAQTFRSLFGFTGSSQAQLSDQAPRASQAPTVQKEQAPLLSELEQQRLGAGHQITETESVTRPDEAAPGLEASGTQLTTRAENKEISTSEEVVAPSPELGSLKPSAISEIEGTTASSTALSDTQSLMSAPEREIEGATVQVTETRLLDPQPLQPPRPQTHAAPEIIEIDSSSEDEDEVDLTVDDVRQRSREMPDTHQDSQAQGLMASQRQVEPSEASQITQPQASQDSFRLLQPERTDDGLLESFIEPEHLYPTLPQQQDPIPVSSELEVNATSAEIEEAASQQATMTDSSRQQPSYPSLPLSPSNSQSLQGMASQALPEGLDAMGGLLPPTPQLTQAESSGSHLQGMLGALEPASHDQLQAEAQPPVGEGVQTTRDNTGTQELASVRPTTEAQSPPAEQIETGRITRAKAKKAAAGRVSNTPDAITSYFSPKRSSTAVAVTNGIEPPTAAEPETNGHHDAEPKHLTNGFSTALAYFTPLSHLDSLLNPSLSQQALGAKNTVDVLAVITSSTTDPVQAKAGPRDHYTIFRITDHTLNPSPTASVRVEVFRPYKNTLPSAKAGDVILLRAFAVKSRKRQAYLISSDASAWCVFHFSEPSTGKGKPKWALKAGEAANGPTTCLSETVNGPPIEFGGEERQRAKDLRQWWDDSRVHDGNEDDANGMNESPTAVARSR